MAKTKKELQEEITALKAEIKSLKLIENTSIYDTMFNNRVQTNQKDEEHGCKLCHYDEDLAPHDILDCPMNCCGTSDGSCLR